MPKDSLEGVRDEYDVIVIGSGLAGLTAANTLARAGHAVFRTRHVHAPGDHGGTYGMFWDRLQAADDPWSELAPGFDLPPGFKDMACFDKSRASALSVAAIAEAVTGADAVVIAGVQTQVCVLATAVDVGRRDLRPVVVAGACASKRPELHAAALQVLASGHAHVVSREELVDAMKRGEP